jgi:tetratricopeptide (TPR) repeat protein
MAVMTPRKCAVATLIAAMVLATLPAARADEAPAAAPASAPAAAAAAPASAAPAGKDITVRAEVGTPLQAAQKLMQEKKFKEALGKIKEAEAVPGRTAFENFMVDQMRTSAALAGGDYDTAISSIESLLASNRLAAAQQRQFGSSLAQLYFAKKNYAKAVSTAQRVLKDGPDPAMQDLMVKAQYANADYAAATSGAKALVAADEAAGRTSSEDRLNLLYSCYDKTANQAGKAAVLEKLLTAYPKKLYWDLAISHVVHRPGFPEWLNLDLLRLRLALNDLRRESDFLEFGGLAIEAGFPIEAKRAVDQGFASGVLGKGAEAERHKRFQARIAKELTGDAAGGDAEPATAEAMLSVGYNQALAGKGEAGVALMEKGLKKGGLKHPDAARLHLGLALLQSGNKARAIEVLHAVTGNEAAVEIAHLWALNAASKH